MVVLRWLVVFAPTGRSRECPARNESAEAPVALVGKQSPYNPGEM